MPSYLARESPPPGDLYLLGRLPTRLPFGFPVFCRLPAITTTTSNHLLTRHSCPPTSMLANFKSHPKSFPIFSPTYQQHLYHQQLYQKQPHIIVALKAPPASRFHTLLWLRTLIPSMDPPSRSPLFGLYLTITLAHV